MAAIGFVSWITGPSGTLVDWSIKTLHGQNFGPYFHTVQYFHVSLDDTLYDS